MTDLPSPAGGDDALNPELADVLRRLMGAEPDPELVQMLRQMGLDEVDPSMLAAVGSQLQSMFSGSGGGPVDASAATDLARKLVAAQGDPSMSSVQVREVHEAFDVARLWLDSVTDFTAHDVTLAAWSRAEWVEATMPVWSELVEPLADGVSSAISSAVQSQLGALGEEGLEGVLPPGVLPAGLLPEGLDAGSALAPMLNQMSRVMFSMQLGQGVGQLAGDVLSGTDVTLPLVPAGTVALVPTNIAAFADGLGVDTAQVRLYLAVRESARTRLFASVPWLAAGVMAAVRDYAADIRIDTDAIEETMRGADLSNPEALQAALQDQLFTPEPSPAQQAALGRLETLLALVEGWVDVVTERATVGKLPQTAALGEAVRRRRATGGPTERAFRNLVGLDLRPRRLRDAANLFAALEDRVGADGRDAAWQHPDLAPASGDLDDPLGYVEVAATGRRPDDMDAALDALLRESAGPELGGSTDGDDSVGRDT